MSVETQIQGQPGGIEGAADWLRDSLATELGDAADCANDARRDASGSWNSEAGDEFVGVMSRARGKIDDLESAAKQMAADLDTFANKLRRSQEQMADVRSAARQAGLSVSGFVVQDPGEGPDRPPDDFVGTEAEVEAHNRRVTAYDAHQELIEAYNDASREAGRIDRYYATACRELQEDYTVGQHASWVLTTGEILGDVGEGAIGVHIVQHPVVNMPQRPRNRRAGPADTGHQLEIFAIFGFIITKRIGQAFRFNGIKAMIGKRCIIGGRFYRCIHVQTHSPSQRTGATQFNQLVNAIVDRAVMSAWTLMYAG